MKEQRIEFKTAVVAKRKGFPQDLFNTGWYNELGVANGRTDINKKGQCFVEAYPNVKCNYGQPPRAYKREFILESYTSVTQSLLQRWLRDMGGIEVAVIPAYSSLELPGLGYALDEKHSFGTDNTLNFLCIVNNQKIREDGIDDYYCYHDTWEEALEKGLYEALKLL